MLAIVAAVAVGILRTLRQIRRMVEDPERLVQEEVDEPREAPPVEEKTLSQPTERKQSLRPAFLFFVVGVLIGVAALHLYQTGDYREWVKLYEQWLRQFAELVQN